MKAATDWHDWHGPYDDPDSPLSRRLRLVQEHVDRWLDERLEPVLTVVSACAGQGVTCSACWPGVPTRPGSGRR
ncbi:hypothetical protein ACFQZ4_10860 [Catellatospora coxensis]